jgi:hypothetical protein
MPAGSPLGRQLPGKAFVPVVGRTKYPLANEPRNQ